MLLRWFTADGVLQAIQAHGVNYIPMVPTMMTYLMRSRDVEGYDVSSLQKVFASAAPVPMELAEGFEKRFDCEVVEAYGQTEAAPALTVSARACRRRRARPGPALPGVELRIEDDDHNEVPAGELGEIVARSPGIMKGYYNLPEATEDTLRHGWLHTGDMGHLDEDGSLFVTERKKDLIIRGGFNVYPRDIEELLYEHPGVAEAAVVGKPDPTMGEEVVAFVVRKRRGRGAPRAGPARPRRGAPREVQAAQGDPVHSTLSRRAPSARSSRRTCARSSVERGLIGRSEHELGKEVATPLPAGRLARTFARPTGRRRSPRRMR